MTIETINQLEQAIETDQTFRFNNETKELTSINDENKYGQNHKVFLGHDGRGIVTIRMYLCNYCKDTYYTIADIQRLSNILPTLALGVVVKWMFANQ